MNIEFEKLRALEEKVKPYLKNGEYTFIGPVDQNLFEPFMKNANNIAPANGFWGRTIHEVLSNKEVISRTLSTVNSNLPLRIYVVNGNLNDMLLHDSIEGYCKKNNISIES